LVREYRSILARRELVRSLRCISLFREIVFSLERHMSASESSILCPSAVADAIQELLRARRTVQDFRAEPVPDAIVERAIEAACWAPNHHRTEPWHFYLLGARARATLAQLNADQVRVARGERAAEIKYQRWMAVPGWLLLTCDRSPERVRETEDYAACCCAAQNLMLALWAQGVGSKWTTGEVTRTDAFYQALDIARESEFVVGMFWYGWPAALVEQHRRPVNQVLARRD
jgi:nitroreductase